MLLFKIQRIFPDFTIPLQISATRGFVHWFFMAPADQFSAYISDPAADSPGLFPISAIVRTVGLHSPNIPQSKNSTTIVVEFFGASDLTRTGDLLITSEMHYRLCYTSGSLAQLLYLYSRQMSILFYVPITP